MAKVRAKKYLGQHFLTDHSIAQNIVNNLSPQKTILEIGPGMGVLTQFIIERESELFVVELDKESVSYLHHHYPSLKNHIISGDFLKLPIEQLFDHQIGLIGNFPYNISSQILFKVLEHKNCITEIVGMFQKEVAERISSKPCKKSYGILSVFIQCYYDVEYLFTVDEDVFDPPPKVKSAVIRLKRNQRQNLPCDEQKFIKVVKTAFGMRRKTLRNALKSLTLLNENSVEKYLNQRAEQLSVEDFFKLTDCFE